MKIDGIDEIRIIASGSKSCRFPDDPRVAAELLHRPLNYCCSEHRFLHASHFPAYVRTGQTTTATTTTTKTPENISSVFSAYRIRGLLYLTSNKRSRRTSSAFRRAARRVMRRPITNVRPTNIKDLLLDSRPLFLSRLISNLPAPRSSCAVRQQPLGRTPPVPASSGFFGTRTILGMVVHR
jgi:hypothetical protein